KTCVELELVIRGGSARRPTTAATLTLPTVMSTEAVAPPLPPPEGGGVGLALGLPGVETGPPPAGFAVTWAVPERPSDVKFTLPRPLWVLPCGSTFPRFVKKRTIVPSATGVPAGSTTNAVMTETAPSEAMKGGFAVSPMVDPGGARKRASPHETS